MPAKRYFVDLFAGCGGLSLGLEQAGWIPVFVNELNRDAMTTYLQNRRAEFPHLQESDLFIDDIKKLVANDGSKLKDLRSGLRRKFKIEWRRHDLDLVVGGPPCQGFSGIGHRRSYSVHKKQLPSNYLYEDMAYVVSILRPKMFLFENVRGLLYSKWSPRGDKGEIWETILAHFSEIGGYKIGSKLVFAKDYGVAQNRPRVLMVGIREELAPASLKHLSQELADWLVPKGTSRSPDLIELLGDLVETKFVNGATITPYPRKPQNELQERLREGAAKAPTDHVCSHHSQRILDKFGEMHKNEGRIPEHMRTKKFAQRLLRPRWGKQGPTITACSLADDYVHFKHPRSLTVREWARLQMFPDRYQFAGKRTTGGLRRAGNPREGVFDRELPKYTQIGNAVPVSLAKCLGTHFDTLLKEADD
jgi:DNA (cytosine-5)-methyltransferase 1